VEGRSRSGGLSAIVRAGIVEDGGETSGLSGLRASLITHLTSKTFPSSRSLHYVTSDIPGICHLFVHGGRQHHPPHTVPQRHRSEKTRKACPDQGDRVRRRGAEVGAFCFRGARDQPAQILLDRVPQAQGRTARAGKEKGTAQGEAGTTRDAARGAVPCSSRCPSHRATAPARARGTGCTECRGSGEIIRGPWRYGCATCAVPS